MSALADNAAAIVTHPSARTAQATPPGFDPQPRWSARFLDTPRRVPGGFVGITATGSQDQHVIIQIVNDDGTPRFGIRSQPICSSYVITRTSTGNALLVTVRTTGSGTRTRYWATARDLSNGDRAWGPVDSGGPWIGPGLVYGPHDTSVVGDTTSDAGSVALDADTGARVAAASPNASVLAEDDGVTLVGHHSASTTPGSASGPSQMQIISAVSDTRPARRWSTTSIRRPAAVTSAWHPRLIGVAAGIMAVQWRAPRGPDGVRSGLYDIQTGTMLHDLGTFAAGKGPLIDTMTGAIVVPGATASAGARIIVAGRVRSLSSSQLHGEAPQLLQAGTLFVGDPNKRISWAVNESDPSRTSGGPWASPTAGTGTMILDARSADLYDLLIRRA